MPLELFLHMTCYRCDVFKDVLKITVLDSFVPASGRGRSIELHRWSEGHLLFGWGSYRGEHGIMWRVVPRGCPAKCSGLTRPSLSESTALQLHAGKFMPPTIIIRNHATPRDVDIRLELNHNSRRAFDLPNPCWGKFSKGSCAIDAYISTFVP